MRRTSVVSWILLALAAILLIPAVVGVSRAGDGITTSTEDVDGIPVTVLTPENADDASPGAVLVHGFAASSTIMEPLGRVLARAGYVVALPDVTGHGANAAPLTWDDTSRDEVADDVTAVLGWLGAQPGVDDQRLALVGHSMGAGAVTRVAITDPEAMRATVAISLPGAIEPVNNPRDLLMLYGSAEPASFATAAREQLDAIRPGADVGQVYGDIAGGTAIAAQVIPGVEHISIVWSPATAEAMLNWIGEAVDGPTEPVSLDPDWLWLLLLLIAGSLVAIPLARLLYGNTGEQPERRVPGWTAMVTTLAAAVLASLITSGITAVAGDAVDAAIPIAVGGYLAVWFAVTAALAWTALLLLQRGQHPRRRPVATRAILATLAMSAYGVLLLIASARLTWATAAFVGPRWWIWVVLTGIFGAYFYADAILLARRSWGARLGILAVNRVILVVVLLASVALLGAPGVLTLLVPLMFALFILLGYLAIVVSTRESAAFAPALVQALPLAAVVATGFPLLGG